MFTKFLAEQTTCATQVRDFIEWHQGVKHFGFWAIEVTASDCLTKIKDHQARLSKYLHQDYLRQPHITLATAGLISNQNNQNVRVAKQIEQLERVKLSPFTIQLSGCDSFSVCPYLGVRDRSGQLNTLREPLKGAPEHEVSDYTPHVTLGFYDKAYETKEIVERISELPSNDVEFTVNEIIYAQYETNEVQGPYKVLHRLKLQDKPQ
ncbi:2'-5' RNA ligase family protein [Reinekea sp.]|jgi:2'-5' RNA ligase|uniref:2'-5' RNA ligase family protein n=1 Tax=Reinekea sp. TaxID=1970455 RepID=UPI003988D46E